MGFEDKATDVANFFGTSRATIWRLTREGRLPVGSYVRLNARTNRYSIDVIKERIAEGWALVPPEKRGNAKN